MADSPVRAMLAASLAERAQPSDRYTLHGWFDGYAIYDHGERIVTIHGPQFGLAAKILRNLREDA